ncbi:ruBisCO large subunit-binding protein subunit beta-1-like isoform X2 [Solanum tuberosum]|uniref:ruBisCO large subunit-binding protein subunit beta-1-like isoform X2 n=1 Tax=Solanum tuberosum TaxID=4113 RepID=UPI0003D244FA|nr:PREDICTED: ruBisCO large subunit-binding protein subunit beta-1-like isoform X2 [Solanum tuberosum]
MSTLKASGPVGQHCNKRVFSVHLKHNPTRIVHELLLVDEKTTNSRDRVNILEDAIRNGYRILSRRIEQQALDTLVVHKLRGALKVAENLKLMVLVSEKASILMTKQPFLEENAGDPS